MPGLGSLEHLAGRALRRLVEPATPLSLQSSLVVSGRYVCVCVCLCVWGGVGRWGGGWVGRSVGGWVWVGWVGAWVGELGG